MKRLAVFAMVCSLLSLGSFAILVVEDRRLGITLPYSMPLAFASMVLLTPFLLLLVGRRVTIPLTEASPSPVEPMTGECRASRGEIEGVVLLDFSPLRGPAR